MEFSSQEQIAYFLTLLSYFLTQEVAHLLVLFKFLRVHNVKVSKCLYTDWILDKEYSEQKRDHD